MLRQSLIAAALALAVVTASGGIGPVAAATQRASAGHHDTRAPAPHESSYQEVGEIPWSAAG
jgi:hypothetical protein